MPETGSSGSAAAGDSVDTLAARYDETPYRDQVFEDVDVSRLLGLARLFHLGPAEPERDKLRVLDLACASGRHLREQASRYPSIQFTGVDFSRTEIEAGQGEILKSGAANVELICADLREFEVSPGEFDVILCRGAFSWVPDEVKDRIFQLCSVGLKRTGVAVIGYLTYPGWKQSEAIRELLAFRSRKLSNPEDRIRESALLLRLLRSGYAANADNPQAQSLLAVVEEMQGSSTNSFVHDELGDIHDPCYFTQFAEWASEKKLQYLAETNLAAMVLGGLPPEAAGILQMLAPDFLETQQLIDYLVNRSGRTSILVRDDADIARDLRPEVLGELEFSTPLAYVRAPSSGPQNCVEFEVPNRERVEITDPQALACLGRMLEHDADAPGLGDLEDRVEQETGARSGLSKTLLGLIAQGHVVPLLPGL